MQAPEQREASHEVHRSMSPLSVDSSIITGEQQHHGDSTTQEESAKPSADAQNASSALDEEEDETNVFGEHDKKVDRIGKSPGEVAFFKLLHAEFNKATHFFEKHNKSLSFEKNEFERE